MGAGLGGNLGNIGSILRDHLKELSKTLDIGLAKAVGGIDFVSHLEVNLNTGGGTDNKFGTAILLPSAGGAIVAGTNANPFQVGGSISFTQTTPSYSYKNITATGSAVIKNSAGTLVRIVINKLAVAPMFLTIYDNNAVGGTQIVGALDVSQVLGPIDYNASATTGISYALAGAGAAGDITVIYQ